MSTETTVLLLAAESLPDSLEEQLAKRNVFVEHAPRAELAQVLPVIVPDLVVVSGDGDLTSTLAAFGEPEAPPLVVIADRGAIRDLRESKIDAIKALIPQDLPIAAIAHRLSTMARRSADGSPLEGSVTKSRSPTKPGAAAAPAKASAARTAASVKQAVRPAAPAPSPVPERGSLAPRPLAPRQDIKILDPEVSARQAEAEAEREKAALAQAEAEQRTMEEIRRKKQAEAAARTRRAAEKRQAEIDRRAEERSKLLEARKQEQERRLAERRREQEQKREERKQELEKRAKERALARKARSASMSPRASDSTPSELQALDQLFPTNDTPQPATARASSPQNQALLAQAEDEVEQLEQTTQAVNISAFASELDREAKRESERASAKATRPAVQSTEPTRPALPREKTDGFGSVKKTEDLSVIVPLPVDFRVDLSPKSELKPIRLALLDIDLTRADAVAAELRDKGMKIHPVTPDPGRTRWPMLRRFAPQGLVVDEKSMARGASEWVETFRGDPFLRHVPVVLVRFSRIFDEASARVTLEPLLSMIDHLGREEFALLEKLRPGRRVDLWLSQVTPYRLVEMLTKEDRNTRLDCRSDTERMVWHLGPGYAGRGKLADLKTDAPKRRLTPQEALSWLLGHEDCQVAVHEHSEPLAHASESKDAEELLREMTEALGAPERHESVRPGAPSQAQKAPSLPAPQAPSAPSLEMLSQSALISDAATALPSPHARASTSGATGQAPTVPLHKRFLSPELRQKFMGHVETARATSVQSYGRYRELIDTRLAPLEPKVPRSILQHVHWAAPVLLLLVAFTIVATSGSSDEPGVEDTKKATAVKQKPAVPKTKDEPSPSAQKGGSPEKESKKTPEEEEPEETEDSGNLWVVEGTKSFPTCEERLGPATPKSPDPARSVGYWKNARRLLMVGKSEEAVESMCLAGLLDPAGPASEGLAEYYLGQRSLEQADRWIKASLKADPDRRKSQELLGDIENQKGNEEAARKILLDTMKLTGDETRKMEMTARKLRQDARLAKKGGDLPRAERELRRAILLSPKDAEIAAELGEVLLRRNAAEAAARWAAHALKLDPNYSSAMLLAGRIAEARGKKDRARTFYEMVPLGDPYHDEAQRRRGRL